MSRSNTPKLYAQLADWWPLLSPVEDYAQEAENYAGILRRAGQLPGDTLLELGSGGGNVAAFLKRHWRLTLVDISPAMQAVSKRLNPECEHCLGDMREVRLGRQFDRVFIHDAIMYMTSEDDLRRAIETAFVHCAPGGAALFVPDFVRETFRPSTDHGGSDDSPRGLRYLEWTYDPDPDDSTYLVDYAYLLRDAQGHVTVEHDRHVEGVFARADWLRFLSDVGFSPSVQPLEDTELGIHYAAFLAIKPE